VILRFSVLLFLPALALSQIELGVRVDAPVAGPLTTHSYPQLCANGAQCGYFESTPYHPAIGLSASVPLTRRFRLRFDPTYQRIGVTGTSSTFAYLTTVNSPLIEIVSKTSTTANRWQLPLLFEAGVARHIRFGIGPAVSVLTDTLTLDWDSLREVMVVDHFLRAPSRPVVGGAAASVEFPFRFGHVTLAPDLRYTRWFDGHFGGNWQLDELTAGVAIRFSR